MSGFEYPTLTVAPDGEHVLVVTLDRPEVLNAINTQMGRRTARALDAPQAEPDRGARSS